MKLEWFQSSERGTSKTKTKSHLQIVHQKSYENENVRLLNGLYIFVYFHDIVQRKEKNILGKRSRLENLGYRRCRIASIMRRKIRWIWDGCYNRGLLFFVWSLMLYQVLSFTVRSKNLWWDLMSPIWFSFLGRIFLRTLWVVIKTVQRSFLSSIQMLY